MLICLLMTGARTRNSATRRTCSRYIIRPSILTMIIICVSLYLTFIRWIQYINIPVDGTNDMKVPASGNSLTIMNIAIHY